MSEIRRGMVQVYMGNGKGKTTAALGLGLRAAGHGFRVIMVQFLKGSNSGELQAVKHLAPNFEIVRLENVPGFFWTLSKAEKKQLEEEIRKNWEYIQRLATEEEYQVMILDEILAVVENGLLGLEEVINLIKTRSVKLELVFTGRNLPLQLLEFVDLITEMKEVKHYFHEGVAARAGIEY